MEDSIKSKGEKIVRTDFNVSSSDKVYEIKKLCAELINIIDSVSCDDSFKDQGEVKRLSAIAITHVETASMFAVKIATSSKLL